ncbi:MAG: protein phosphatase 2C domain-containing protein [Pseudomonadota bacterium]
MPKLVGAGQSHVGLRRSNNEDSYFFDDELGLYLVADGMGGAASGELASRMTADAVAGYVRSFYGKSLGEPGRYDFFDAAMSPRANTLLQGIHLANRLVYDAAHKNDRNSGMGSTLAVVFRDDDHVLAVNVGDSRVFLSRQGKFEQLTADHRLADDPKYRGLVNPEATIMSQMGHTLTRAMGVRREVDPDVQRLPLREGDLFLLCSDGLSDMVEPDMIAEVLSLDRSLESKARDLIELALAGGGRDNVTAVLAQSEAKSRLKSLLIRLAGGG